MFKPVFGRDVAALAAIMSLASFTPSGAATESGEPYLSAKDGGPRRLEVTAEQTAMFPKPDLGATASLTLDHGAVLLNMGCQDADEAVLCTVRPFRGGPKGFVAATDLQPATAPDGVVPMGPNPTPKRAGKKDFDASGTITCAQERGQALGPCKAAVARSPGGDATIIATFPNGFARKLYFMHGEFTSASATMSGVGKDTEWRLENGTHHFRVDDQRFEVSDAFVFGE